MTDSSSVYDNRAEYSRMRLTELRKKLASLPELEDFKSLSVFGAGSYARLEASRYSDIDLFFLCGGDKGDLSQPNTTCLRLFGRVIEIVDALSFPKLSNDCQYLTVLYAKDILRHLGSPIDDHDNYFTARMLLLLESHCLYGDAAFEEITADIVSSYFKDFPDHKQTFQPMFLLNDICRFWKTLLLNYENRRNVLPSTADMELRKTRQKVRNFKLKYSRMTTCFASIAALGSHKVPVTQEQVIELTKLTPRQRLQSIASRVPDVRDEVDEVLRQYVWFLEMTGLPTAELEGHFGDKQKRTEMFQQANDYGDSMFTLLRAIDATDPSFKLLRYLVI